MWGLSHNKLQSVFVLQHVFRIEDLCLDTQIRLVSTINALFSFGLFVVFVDNKIYPYSNLLLPTTQKDPATSTPCILKCDIYDIVTKSTDHKDFLRMQSGSVRRQ